VWYRISEFRFPKPAIGQIVLPAISRLTASLAMTSVKRTFRKIRGLSTFRANAEASPMLDLTQGESRPDSGVPRLSTRPGIYAA
jgi:hypothetical protein